MSNTIQVANRFCCKVNMTIVAGMGNVSLHYKPGEAICGRCILCVLLQQVSANQEPKPVRICPALLERCPHDCTAEQARECEEIVSNED